MKKTLIITLIASLFTSCMNKEGNISSEKELYLPQKIAMVPDSNDYSDPTSEFSYQRSLQSNNLVIFWHQEYGDHPMENPDSSKRFNPAEALAECDRFYNYYIDELKMVEKGNSLTDKYKMLIFVFGGDGGTAFGGGEENKVGILWTPAVRINKKPYGALAHEMAHSFQYISKNDCGQGPHGPIMEMSAQYMLWQVYPEWMTFENYHLEAFMNGTHFAFLHPENMYHSPYVLEYWSEKHGKDFFGKLSRETLEGEDPVSTYKRINGISQEEFNDEIFDACRHFITWDFERVKKEAKHYANQHKTKLIKLGENHFRIDSSVCPQNYGYNAIELKVPEAGSDIEVIFKGIAGSKGYAKEHIDKASWRYGFLASLSKGKTIYGKMYKEVNGEAIFRVPKNTQHLWLVVSGVPTEHWPIEFHWGKPKEEQAKYEQWPYELKFKGTTYINNETIL